MRGRVLAPTSHARARASALGESVVEHKERRRHARKRVDLAVQYRVAGGEEASARATDMSMGGRFIERAQAPFGASVTLVFRVPAPAHEVHASAVVRWTTPSGMGVQFQQLGAQDTYAITEYLAKCEPIAAEPG